MKKLKKAFTIVELVIVIAVIAILAAVLIPTFVNVTKNAKLSADQQAVYNMNLVLQADEALNGAPSNLKEAKEVLAEGGYNTKLTPSLSGYNYYWNSYYNIVMLIKVDGWELVYPLTDDANEAYDFYKGQCFNLSINTTQEQDEILETVKNGGTVAVTTKDNFSDIVTLSRDIGETFKGATIQLTADLDLGGDTIDPMYEFAGTFDGNGKTIRNFLIVPVHGTDGNGYQYYAMTNYAEKGSEAVITKDKKTYGIFGALTEGGIVKDLNVVYNDTEAPEEPGNEYTYFGGIVGLLDGGTIENCTVSGSIHQYNRVGGIVGTALAGTIKNCTVTADITSYAVTASPNDRNSYASYSYAGGLIAYTGNAVRQVKDSLSVTNCTVGSDEEQIALKASWATGAITAWMSFNTDLTVSNTTVQNVEVVANAYYAALLVGNIGTSDVQLNLTSVNLSGTSTVERMPYGSESSSTNAANAAKSTYTPSETPSNCDTVTDGRLLFLNDKTNGILLVFSESEYFSLVKIGTITG